MADAAEKVRRLPYWRSPVDPRPLKGGITNTNFAVEHEGARYFVRVGDDIPLHQVMRFNERAASQAAFAAGLSPELLYSEPGVLLFRYIEGRALSPAEVRSPANLGRIVELVRRVHVTMPEHLRGPALIFWVFHVIRDYAHTLRAGRSRHEARLQGLIDCAAGLEAETGAVTVVYGHNDLLAGNIMDDGARLWLIDWDYAGFNTPLFDLANLASNNELGPEQERFVLERYFGAPPSAALWRQHSAMKCASLLRETMWGMVSEIHSVLDVDFAAYTVENLARFERALARHQALERP